MTERDISISKEEGESIQIFRFAMRSIVTQIVVGVSLEKFTELFSDVFSASRSRKLYDVLGKEIIEGTMTDIEEIITIAELDKKLKQLSKIVEECPIDSNVKSWRPTGDVSEHLRSFLAVEKLNRKRKLEAFVEKKEAKLQELNLELAVKRLKLQQVAENTTKWKSNFVSHYENRSQILMNVTEQELKFHQQEDTESQHK